MPRKPADYPDWVMKFKEKGTYINKVGDKYYLYAAHSERIKGTDKVRRVSDGYIGRITREDGLIKAGPKLKEPPILYEAGLSYAITALTPLILSGLQRSYRKNGSMVYCGSILTFIYGAASAPLFEHSYLCLAFSGISFPGRFTQAQQAGIERGTRMLNDVLTRVLGDDLVPFMRRFPDIRLVKAGGTFYLCGLDEETRALSEKYSIEWEDPLWQR